MRIKVKKQDVVEKNRTFIEGFVADLRPNDEMPLVLKRVGDKVTVSPDNTFDDSIEVVFRPHLVLAVTDINDDLNDLVNLLKGASLGVVGALGSDPLNLTAVGSGIGSATVDTLKKLMGNKRNEDTFTLLIPVETEKTAGGKKEEGENETVELEMRSFVIGFTITTDGDSDEIAHIEFVSDLDGKRGNNVVTSNIGKEQQIKISDQPSVVSIENPKQQVNSSLISAFKVRTDGGAISNTISAIKIDTIKINLNVKAKGKETKTTKQGSSSTPKDKTSLRTIEGIGEEKAQRFAEAGIRTIGELARLSTSATVPGFSKKELHDYLIPSAKLLMLNFNEEEVEGLVKAFNVRNIADVATVALEVSSVGDLTRAFTKSKVQFPADFDASELFVKLKSIL